MAHFPRMFRKPAAAFVHDLAMIPLAWLGAYWLRFNLQVIPDDMLSGAMRVLPALMVTQGIVLWHFGLYRGVWRFASMPDLVRIFKAAVVGACLGAIAIFFLTRMQGVPRSALPLYGLLLICLLGGPRLLYRLLKEHGLRHGNKKNVLIIGAGRAGEMLVRDLLADRKHAYRPVGFLDDDARKRGREIHGVRVVGNIMDAPAVAQAVAADLIVLAIPSATSRQMRRVVGLCEQAGVSFRTLPSVHELVNRRPRIGETRDVAIEDLLGREPVSLDWESIRSAIANRRVLVSGGGGSIGSELCRQVAHLNPSALTVLDRGEYNLYAVQTELEQKFPRLNMRFVLGDVCDESRLDRVIGESKPEAVFHAAAYKQVPLLESQIREAVRNNVLGTLTIARAAGRHRCGVFVLISTDKAVNPSSTMGTTKRLAEIACQTVSRTHESTRFITVRFGNVLDSAGSVVPLFRSQIASGGPVSVTHPSVERYFMTIPEASQLILEAAAIGQGDEVFVLDMGEPIKIDYLARQMIRLAGKKPDEDVQIVYTGLRPGEKLSEELFHDQENLTATGHDKILLARHRKQDWIVLEQGLQMLELASAKHDDSALETLLGDLVPESLRSRTSAPFTNVVSLGRARQ